MAEPAGSQTRQVFLSYSRTDRNAVVVLRAALERAGLAVFHDEDAIRVGDRWITRLEEALQGCSTFVLLVGRDGVRGWVGAEAQVALIRHLSPRDVAQRLSIFPILLEAAKPEELPPFLALFQSAQWSPADPVPEALLETIRTRASRFDYRYTFEGCPFVGLNAFGRLDAKLFFGRRKETMEALACLGDQEQSNPERMRGKVDTNYHRWLQIEGNSGAGKSSLVNAGMLPMIEQGALWARTGFERWRVLGPMMPGKEPLAKLAEVLEQGLIADATQRDGLRRLQRLEKDERALAFALRDFTEGQTAFLLIVDQFEELFTVAEDAPRKQVDALLANALQDSDCPLFLISTVRADFLDRFEQLPYLQAIYNSHCKRYFLPTISEHGLREAIEQPACLAELDVRDVTVAILEDARDEIGALPLVENALFTLWQHREGNRLSGGRYRQADGIAGMLSAQADALLERINRVVHNGRQAALELLLRLTRINAEGRHSRQRITREEAVLVAGAGKDVLGERVVQLLSGERPRDVLSGSRNGALRLITINVEEGQQYVDLIHETLIRARTKDEKSGKLIGYWPTLYDYIEKNRDRDIHRQQLRFQTERWVQSNWLGRLWNLAYLDFGRYRALRVPRRTPEGQFLSWSRWAGSGLALLLALLVGFVGDSYYWIRKHDLPLDSMLMLQRYRLGYAPLPVMTAIPAGAVDMGEQDEAFVKSIDQGFFQYFGLPGRKGVEIARGFRLGKHEVTYEQFDYYVWAQHQAGHGEVAFPTTAKGGRGLRPVVNVTWSEAAAYAKWLAERSHQNCRLPTEAEWEYAARAGTNTAYWWGDDIGKDNANCEGCGRQGGKGQSAPVGTFPANAFGLHDTSGNVWEWTCSAWRVTFDGSEQRCVDKDKSSARVLRGGSWREGPDRARSAARARTPDFRYGLIGFRVLCSSPIE